MAIDELGLSLLARQERLSEEERERRRKMRKRERRQELLGKAAGIGIDIGNRVLAEKANDFLNSEEMWQRRVNLKNATNNVDVVYQERDAIAASGLKDFEYFGKKARPQFIQSLKEHTPYIQEGTDAFDRVVSDNVSKIGMERALAHRERVNLANQIATEKSYEAMIKINNKRPKDLGGLIIRAARRKFGGGKSKEEIDKIALEAIRTSKLTTSVDQFNTLMERYHQVGDVESALDYAKIEVPDDDKRDEKIEEKIEYKNAGEGRLFRVKITKTTDIATGNVSETSDFDPSNPSASIISLAALTDEEIEAEQVKALNSSFHILKDGYPLFTPDAWAGYLKSMNEKGIDINRIISVADYAIASQTYMDWSRMTDDSGTAINLKDAARDAQKLAGYEIAGNIGMDMVGLKLSLAKTQEERNRLTTELTNLMTSIAEVMGTTDIDPRARAIDPANPFIVKDKNGKPWAFPTQEDADKFKRDQGLL